MSLDLRLVGGAVGLALLALLIPSQSVKLVVIGCVALGLVLAVIVRGT